MSRLIGYISILGTMLIGAHLLELIDNTGTSILLSWLADPSNLFTSSFFTNLSAILTLFAVVGIAAGIFLSQKTDQAALIGITSLFFLVGWDILAIYNELKEINSDFAILLVSPFLLVYMLTVIEWWRGRD